MKTVDPHHYDPNDTHDIIAWCRECDSEKDPNDAFCYDCECDTSSDYA